MALGKEVGQRTGIAALLALVAAVVGAVFVVTGNFGWGLLLEGGAAVLGAIGFFMAASPRVGGGVMSIIAIVIAVFGIGISVLGVIGTVIF